MALRVGLAGENLWPLCRQHGVAAITYDPIDNTDLSTYGNADRPAAWRQLSGSQPGSMNAFGWSIRGGDALYVRESGAGGLMVGLGTVKGEVGDRAYHFQASSPIREVSGKQWHHLVNVDWDNSFVGFLYKDRSPNTTVLRATQEERQQWNLASTITSHKNENLTDEELRTALLLESSYSRYTAPSLRLIVRLHAKLSNAFRAWMLATRGIIVKQEIDRIDCAFIEDGKRTMVEFKIAYEGNTRRAIREALGQILEYNFYPSRKLHQRWMLILDIPPSSDDLKYVWSLKAELKLPLIIGWPNETGFECN